MESQQRRDRDARVALARSLRRDAARRPESEIREPDEPVSTTHKATPFPCARQRRDVDQSRCHRYPQTGQLHEKPRTRVPLATSHHGHRSRRTIQGIAGKLEPTHVCRAPRLRDIRTLRWHLCAPLPRRWLLPRPRCSLPSAAASPRRGAHRGTAGAHRWPRCPTTCGTPPCRCGSTPGYQQPRSPSGPDAGSRRRSTRVRVSTPASALPQMRPKLCPPFALTSGPERVPVRLSEAATG